jgi:hypothetical protein
VSARKLALELMQLEVRERELLLAELPQQRRDELKELMREAASIANGGVRPFENHLQAAEKSVGPSVELAGLNDGQLRILLSTEQPVVRERVIGAIRSGEIESWPPSVRRVVLAWLCAHRHTSSIAAPERRRSRPFWAGWAIWRKSA